MDTEKEDDWTEVGVVTLTDHHGYQIAGQSVAATRSCLVLPDFDLVFDCGYCPKLAMLQEIVTISHGHADHIGTLHRHAFDRHMHRHSEPTYIMPKEIVEHWHQAHDGYRKMNYNMSSPYAPRDYSVIPVPTTKLPANGQDSIDHPIYYLPKGKGKLYFLTAYKMHHSIPDVAYIIWEIKKKLDPKYAELSSKEIGQLVKLQKIDPSVRYNIPRVGYSGDTTIKGLLANPDLFQVETLMLECTYIYEGNGEEDKRSQEEAQQRHHMHEGDILAYKDLFQNKELILFHFSSQYKASQIREAKERLQTAFGSRLIVQVFI